jgi:tetratricopeptide (TPR) repeat protein
VKAALLKISVLWLIAPVAAQGERSVAEVRMLIEQRQLARAEDSVVRHIANEAHNPQWILLLAEIRLDQQRHEESLQLLEGARQLGDSSAQTHLLAGLNYVALNRLDLAEPEFRAALDRDPRSAPASYYLGRLLYTKNLFPEAIEKTKKAIELDPNLVRAYDNLALCYEAIQNEPEAERTYLAGVNKQRASGLKVEWPALNLGLLLLRSGDTVRAKGYFEEALKINPNSAEAHFRLGVVLEKDKDFDGALERYRKAVEADPKLAKSYYRSALIFLRIGKDAEAKAQFRAFEQNSSRKQ